MLGEHRELHGLYNILSQSKAGYARHPETLRWTKHLPALVLRHDLLLAEMQLRGYRHRSPLERPTKSPVWPEHYLDAPGRQLGLLADKYIDGRSGRIPLPRNAQEFWAQHKYSVMARAPGLYAELGPQLATGGYRDDLDGLARLLVEALRKPVSPGRLLNALQHMWGHVNGDDESLPEGPAALLAEIQLRALAREEPYLMQSTALSELAVWL